MALPAAEPAVEANQLFERGALIGVGVIEAVDEQVGAVVEAARAAEMVSGVRPKDGKRVGALDATVVEMMDPCRADDEIAVDIVSDQDQPDALIAR
jgi:hypothetical protein